MLGLPLNWQQEELHHDSTLLYNSILSNEHDAIDVAIARGALLDHVDRKAPPTIRTPLRAACAYANIKAIRTLLARSADIFANFEHDRWTALHSAAHSGHDHVMRVLVAEAESLHENSRIDGFAMMHMLVECACSQLLCDGADIILWAKRHLPNLEVDACSQRRGYQDWTPLHLACARGQLKAASALLRLGAKAHARTGDFHVRSPLVNELAHTGPDDHNGAHTVAWRLCWDSRHPSNHPSNGAHVASFEPGLITECSQWLDRGLLPIHLAAFGGHLALVQMLVRQGQPVNSTTTCQSWTALMFGVWSGDVPLVREICRIGGKHAINVVDHRADGSEWTSLSLAVARWDAEMVKTLIAYGADPLVRLSAADFPGSAFVKHCAPKLLDAPNNRWSGPDKRISLLHLAILRGNLEMIRTLLPLMRAAHHHPVRIADRRPSHHAIPWRDISRDDVGRRVETPRSGAGTPRSGGRAETPRSSRVETPRSSRVETPRSRRCSETPRSLMQEDRSAGIARALDSSRAVHEKARERQVNAPVLEAQDCDPVTFCTSEGWSPAVLALLLHTVDPARRVRIELFQEFPDPSAGDNTRADVFLELLKTGRSLLEDRPDVSPPVMPQRFPDVSEALVTLAIDQFVHLCQVGNAERIAYRILHKTLCVAVRFDRHIIVRHLLESGLCDPRCCFLHPVECRPLHIATSCGFGHMAQLLLEHHADPLEKDEGKERPIYKLSCYYVRQVAQLNARVADLQAELREIQDGARTTLSPRARSSSRVVVERGLPTTPQLDSVVHGSRM